MFCRNCGNLLTESETICRQCGFAVGTGEQFCEHCGSEVYPYAVSCETCGTAINRYSPKKKKKTFAQTQAVYAVAPDMQPMPQYSAQPFAYPPTTYQNAAATAYQGRSIDSGSTRTHKSQKKALRLAILLGVFGAHDCYLEHYGLFVMHLLFAFFALIATLITLPASLLMVGFWLIVSELSSLIEIFIMLRHSKQIKERRKRFGHKK